MYDRDSIMMGIINRNIPYKDKKEIINIMTESVDLKEKTYFNIANYFYGKTFKNIGDIKMEKDYFESKGNITKSKFLNSTIESLDLISNNMPTFAPNAMIVKTALANLKNRSKFFELAFKTESKLSCLLYGTISKACLKTTSLMICNNGLGGKFNSIDNFIFDGLTLFNRSCANGTVDKMIKYDINLGDKTVHEGVFDDAVNLAVSVASALITGLRRLVYWVYYSRIDLADYLEQQAAYLEMNKLAIENRKDINENKKKEIIEKQTKWQKRLIELSDKIQVDDIKAARKAKTDAEKDEKTIKSTDINPSDGEVVPDFF